ncbi:IgGFc-binding protein-like [Morone saxatilis]|uniref:IgGFc-binding protein-like n=1 Tax=Morone saxatilis TaxID=34816 RepID=UPI0015E24DC3|nr:IgGFc-binding protein-like [Morone saxatilis]
MLRPLLFLSALIGLSGATVLLNQGFNDSLALNISQCPITFYGKKYEQLYVNITSGNVTVCFNGFFNPQTGQDCIVAPPFNTTSAKAGIVSEAPVSPSPIQAALSTIKTNETCFVRVQHVTTVVLMDALVNGTKVDTFNATGSGAKTEAYFDISGCRQSGGALFRYGAVISSDPESCSGLRCDVTAVVTNFSCGPSERCQGNNTCMFDSTCTVSGPAVIDIHGQVNSVQDRCAYTLMSTPSVPDLQVLANFQERRRKDVSFVDSVTLRLNSTGVYIHLKQDGRVQVDNTTLTLNSSVQLIHGVELSKDQTGVTAKVSLSNYTTSVFFDGKTAQIRLKGPAGKVPSLQGLCGNSSSSLSELRLSEYSASGCETQYNETTNSTINCNMTTERCNLLKEAPFTACHSDINPEPYITACNNTLCKYPVVDGLNCQFLEGYARACSLHNITLEGWRSNVSCSPPQAFCQDKICSAHEFCAEKTGCLCRAIFASPYRSTDTLGDPTVCSQNSASLTLVGCLLAEKGIDYSALHLKDQNCTGQMDKLTNMVTFSFNSSSTCGTEVSTSNSQLIYKNAIMTQNSSDIIIRNSQFYIDFSCFYTQPGIKSVGLRIRHSSVIKQIISGTWNYTLTMKAYTDAGRTQAVESNSKIQLNQKIWVELETDGLDGNSVAVVTDSCWATNQASPNGSVKYDLIKKGCANSADQTVKVEGNGQGTSNYFSFNMFQFSGNSTDLYLHCKLDLCVTQNNTCNPVCNGGSRRRRSARLTYVNEAPTLITMAWTD